MNSNVTMTASTITFAPRTRRAPVSSSSTKAARLGASFQRATEWATKSLACGLGALAITAVVGLSFVQSTSVAPWGAAASQPQMAQVQVHPKHMLFGQSLPAVLVD